MIFVDTNVLLDVLQDDARWALWSVDRLSDARNEGNVVIDAIVIAELGRDYPTYADLCRVLVSFELTVEPLDEVAAFTAGHRFVEARRNRPAGAPRHPLADFFIGAHALSLGVPLLTRDPKLYRRYFPELTLITPETHP